MERYCVSIRLDASRQLDGIRTASYPHTNGKSQKEVFAHLRGLLTVGVTYPDVYSSCSNEERLRMIGASLNSCNEAEWIAHNRKELEWIEANGYSVEAAKAADRRWTERWTATGFFDWKVKDGEFDDGEVLVSPERDL